MTDRIDAEWDPSRYARFGSLRLRPAVDLLRSAGPLPEGAVVDLGCGNGTVGEALSALGHELVGVDSAPAMLETARATDHYTRLEASDIADWSPDAPPAMIFSNAALHWVPDHRLLMPRLAGHLAPGGVLAVQMPHQNNAPSHRLWRSLMDEHFPGRGPEPGLPGVLLPAEYHRLLSDLGDLSIWETEYYQVLEPAADGHPVRRFTEATYGRPFLGVLDASEQAHLIAAYEDVIGKAYPPEADGRVLFPIRRLFFTLRIPG